MTQVNMTIIVPAALIKLSDSVAIDPAKIHIASWPGVIKGVGRNMQSEASRSVIAKMQKEFAEGKWNGFTFVADTKANRDAGKTPTSLADAKAAREAWQEAHPVIYDKWLTDAEIAAVETLYDGTFRNRESAEPRVVSLTPVEVRTQHNGRMEFDSEFLPKHGIVPPTDKAGKLLPLNHKKLAELDVPTKSEGVVAYPRAFELYMSKHGARHADYAVKQLEKEAKDRARLAATVTDSDI